MVLVLVSVLLLVMKQTVPTGRSQLLEVLGGLFRRIERGMVAPRDSTPRWSEDVRAVVSSEER